MGGFGFGLGSIGTGTSFLSFGLRFGKIYWALLLHEVEVGTK
jgi:hypothetical protein